MVQGKDEDVLSGIDAKGPEAGASLKTGPPRSSGENGAPSGAASKAGVWDRPNFNFVIDAVMFLVMMAMAGLGFLMKYVLIPGRESWAKYGRNVNLAWWGWDRHDWGAIHLYLGFLLLGLLSLHLYLHWRQIVGLFQRFIPPERRGLVLVVFLILAVVLICFPFLISPEVSEAGRGMGQRPR